MDWNFNEKRGAVNDARHGGKAFGGWHEESERRAGTWFEHRDRGGDAAGVALALCV